MGDMIPARNCIFETNIPDRGRKQSQPPEQTHIYTFETNIPDRGRKRDALDAEYYDPYDLKPTSPTGDGNCSTCLDIPWKWC